MRRANRATAVLTALLMAAAPAPAAIIGTCTIMVTRQGTMTVSPALTVLGSKQAMGLGATLQVTASSLLCSLLNILDCYSFSAPAPISFLSAPSGGDVNVGFASVFRLNGAGTEFPGGSPQRLVNGTHGVEIDLTATKSSGLFRNGAYQAQVVARCE